MREDNNPHLWINELALEQARQYLTDSGLSFQGIAPVLRARLLRFEQFDADLQSPAPTPQKDDRPTRSLPVPPFALGKEKGESAMETTDDSRP